MNNNPQNLVFRLATQADLPAIISMLKDDALGAKRESHDEAVTDKYLLAFKRISTDPHQELTIVEFDGVAVATFQISWIQYLTHHGGLRAQVEAVRTHAGYRGQGIGKRVFAYIIGRAKEKGCNMVQLTTDKQRLSAIRFYETLGFVPSHEGMKLKL